LAANPVGLLSSRSKKDLAVLSEQDKSGYLAGEKIEDARKWGAING
jgi:hypothetical protein